MLNVSNDNKQKKSPKQRFLFVIGILFFLVYLALGLIVIFWEKFPLAMDKPYRIAFGVLLVVYASFRFLRLLHTEKD